MADSEIQARELALRERALELEERKMRTSFVDWLKGLGLPIASLVASVAVFLVQAQQQGFERSLNSVRDGYKMYFDGVSKVDLKTVDDYYDAKRVLETTTKIYPEVFCGARNDLVTRIMSAPMNVDREPLMAEINELPAPDPSAGLTQPKWLKLAWLEPSLPTCNTLPKAGPADAANTPATAAAPQTAPSNGVAAKDAKSETAKIAPSAPSPAAAADQAATPQRAYRVFVQVGPTRDRDAINAMSGEAATLGYRMSGAEQMRWPINRAEVRYFGPDQQADAEALAKWMTTKFASEGIAFRARAIGKMFPNLPEDTMEVWVPDSAAAVAGGLKDLKDRAVDAARQKLPGWQQKQGGGASTTPNP
jgi:hypothetical protein